MTFFQGAALCLADAYPWACQDLLPVGNLASAVSAGISVQSTDTLAEGCRSRINWEALQL